MAEAKADCNSEMSMLAGVRGFAAAAGRFGPPLRRPHRRGAFPGSRKALNRRQQPTGLLRMPKMPDELLAFLESLGLSVSTVRHPPLFTVAESQSLRGEIAGGHTKNLFLKDKKGAYFLVTVEEEAVVDLKTIHNLIGASGRVSFGKPDMLMELLGVVPGAVTVFGAVNDTEGRVKIVLDEGLMREETINAHPLTNEATTSIRSGDLLAFLRATGHEPHILKVAT
jgi:Ala-tRNA(Pro) deacylase